MPAASDRILKPRKTPRQARSEATVEAIFDATIQVLLAEGAARLTTTRVAERAGVSVGTMYQYFPNKQALLHAVLKRHLDGLIDKVEKACRALAGETIAVISDGLVAAYLQAKMDSFDTARALYAVGAELDLGSLQAANSKRVGEAVMAVLTSALDVRFEDVRVVAFTLHVTVAGAVGAVLERGGSRARAKILASELPIMCRAYLTAVAKRK
ncbi:MAG: TetR/AcrR family transcriptional regulator [Hyphomonadaceae bacterium]|nr:TetR/AcrR family transcriptional regulator [Hyphomonadaceae bacterium]